MTTSHFGKYKDATYCLLTSHNTVTCYWSSDVYQRSHQQSNFSFEKSALDVIYLFVSHCRGNKQLCKCTEGFISVQTLKWQVSGAVSSPRGSSCHIPESYFLFRKTSIFTSTHRSLWIGNKPYPLACFSVLLPVVIPPVPALPQLFDDFFQSITFLREYFWGKNILTANTLHSSCWTEAWLQSKVYIPATSGNAALWGFGPDLRVTSPESRMEAVMLSYRCVFNMSTTLIYS